jgi:hypothetical protein
MKGPTHFYSPEDGDIIYHYTTFKAALSILETGTIWLSDFEKTNDSSEFIYARNEFLNQLKISNATRFMPLKFLVASAIGSINNHTKMFIGSFTSEQNELSQWRSYAHNGQGCVLGFSAKWFEQFAGISIRRVRYGPEEIKLFTDLSLEMLNEQFLEKPENQEEIRSLAQFIAADLFSFKHPSYSLEKEIRISRMALKNTKSGRVYKAASGKTAAGESLKSLPVKVRETSYGSTHYLELSFRNKNGDALQSVGCGPVSSARVEIALGQLVRKHYPTMTIWRSSIPMR